MHVGISREREREGLFSTIQQNICRPSTKRQQQNKVEGYRKGTRPILAGHPLQKIIITIIIVIFNEELAGGQARATTEVRVQRGGWREIFEFDDDARRGHSKTLFKHGFRLDVRKYFFSNRIIQWNLVS